MAKVTLSERKFKLIPEGTTTFKVVKVDDSKYEKFGKLEVTLQTAKGETHIEKFTLLKTNGDLNEGALNSWSYFARTCLNNFQADEIDTQDIVGCYIVATVKHESYEKKDGGEGTAVRINDYSTASSFGDNSDETNPVDDLEDLDDLDDLDNL